LASELRTISIIGLGKLGCPMAACFASRGFRVVGVDREKRVVDALNRGKAPVYEPGLPELLGEVSGRLTATRDHRRAVLESQASFIVVPTPSEEDGWLSLKFVEDASRQIGSALREKRDPHLVVLASTVMPGSTEGAVRGWLESESESAEGAGFQLCYCPEFFALGSVLANLHNPDLVLIGACSAEGGERLEGFYRRICDNRPPIFRVSPVNAELAKLAVNTYVSTKITYANMLARLCEQIPGADVDEVTSVMGADSRIGSRALRGALGYGGCCFPRDQRALSKLASAFGVPGHLAEATQRTNALQVPLLKQRVLDHLSPGERVAVLGLSFKPGTDVVEASQGIGLARSLAADGIPVSVFDPVASEGALEILGDSVRVSASLEECLDGAAVVVVAAAWPEFRRLPLEEKGPRPVVIDCWRSVEPTPGIRHVPLGRGPIAGK
jgi:UDPglucose 6-dehydrogenase